MDTSEVTEQFLAKCPKRLHFSLYKSNYSKTPFPSTLLNVDEVWAQECLKV